MQLSLLMNFIQATSTSKLASPNFPSSSSSNGAPYGDELEQWFNRRISKAAMAQLGMPVSPDGSPYMHIPHTTPHGGASPFTPASYPPWPPQRSSPRDYPDANYLRTPAATIVSSSPAIPPYNSSAYDPHCPYPYGDSPQFIPGSSHSSPTLFPPSGLPCFGSVSAPDFSQPPRRKSSVSSTDRDKQAQLESSFRLVTTPEGSSNDKHHCQCGRVYSSKKTLNKHWNGCKENPNQSSYPCDICDETFTRKDVLKKHRLTHKRH